MEETVGKDGGGGVLEVIEGMGEGGEDRGLSQHALRRQVWNLTLLPTGSREQKGKQITPNSR